MWEHLQITILRTNLKIVGTHTFRKFLLTLLKKFRLIFKTKMKRGFSNRK
ncbi:hypothetical protein LEP1GSC021_4490 [Leptospira noguchii str. 1993005606]|nr:hypothetical protein LEP1GSC021_4490 [Leptospira noguchii str. 1993005606]